MGRSGIRGINKILIIGKISGDSIPIGPDTTPASIMTRIFIISTIVVRGKAGIKDTMASVLLKPPVMALVAVI